MRLKAFFGKHIQFPNVCALPQQMFFFRQQCALQFPARCILQWFPRLIVPGNFSEYAFRLPPK